jgi:hypothetical protein
MKRAWIVSAVLALGAISSGCGPEPITATEPPDPPTAEAGFPCEVHVVLQASCASCHAGRLYYGPNFDSRADLFRTAADLFLVPPNHPVAPGTFGEHIASALRDGTMPPYGALTVPSAADRELVIAWVAAGMPAGDCGALVSTP